MSEPSDLALLWRNTLTLLDEKGWELAEAELTRKLHVTRSLASSAQGSLDALNLVLGTLQQKFGDLHSAPRSLELASASRDRVVATEAQIRLAKVYAQKGDFLKAESELRKLVPTRGSRGAWGGAPGVPPSVLWRLGFTTGANGDLRDSSYWFDRHRDATIGRHGSQLSNNLVFSSLIDLLGRSPGLEALHESDMRAIHGYLVDGLSVDDVKFLNVSKSVVVPLLLEAVLLLLVKQLLDGLVQLLVCRRLLQYDGLSVKSEGIADALHLLGRMEEGRLATAVMRRTGLAEDRFLEWLRTRVGDDLVVMRAVEEAGERFEEFRRGRNYARLTVTDTAFPSVARGPGGRPVYFSWAGSRSTGLELRLFLYEQLGVKVLAPDSPQFLGHTKSAIVDEVARVAWVGVIHLDSSTTFEAGALRRALGPDRIVFLSTEGSDDAGDLGLATIPVDERRPTACFDRLRREVLAGLGQRERRA